MVECWICRRTTEDLEKWVKDHADDFTDLENPLHPSKVMAELISEWIADYDNPFMSYRGIQVCVVCDFTIRSLVVREVRRDYGEIEEFLEIKIKSVIRDALKE